MPRYPLYSLVYNKHVYFEYKLGKHNAVEAADNINKAFGGRYS